MKTILRPYPEYKDSGLSLLDSIPDHWETKRLKNWVDLNRSVLPEDTVPDFEMDYIDISSVGTGGLVSRPQRVRFKDSPSRARRVLSRGDTIVSTVRTYLKAIHFVSDAPSNLVCSTGFSVLSPHQGTDPKFVTYLAHSTFFTDQVTAQSVGIAYPAISESKLAACHAVVPPRGEQAAIVRFLDQANQKTRRFIQAKRRLIDLLNAQRQAVISSVVTRGLRSSESNPSTNPHLNNQQNQLGIPWLEAIPGHWDVMPSKRLFTVRKELARADDIQLSATQAYGVIPQAVFEEKVGRKVVRISMHLEKRRHVEKGDFVISMRSFQGGLERAWSAGCIRSSYVVLKPGPHVNVDYFAYLFKSHDYILALRATANFIRDGQDLNFSNFCLVYLPAVPQDEQKAIAAYLDRATRNINAAMDRAREEIKLFQEYHVRLIADVVTGKLDVREAAERLPSLAGPAALDDEHIDLSALDPEEADDLDDDPELLPVAAEEE